MTVIVEQENDEREQIKFKETDHRFKFTWYDCSVNFQSVKNKALCRGNKNERATTREIYAFSYNFFFLP